MAWLVSVTGRMGTHTLILSSEWHWCLWSYLLSSVVWTVLDRNAQEPPASCAQVKHTSEFMWLDLLVVNPLACPPALHCMLQYFWKVSFTWQILPQLLGQWLRGWEREKMQEACIVYEELKQVIFSYFKEPCTGLATPQICTQIRYHEVAEHQRRETVTEEQSPLWELQPEWQQVSTETNRSYKAKKTSKCREKIMINWGFYTW